MVSISVGNRKMGQIKSVSLPSIVTCVTDCSCKNKCYAKRIEKRYKNSRLAYKNNLDILNNNPELYWREVEAAIMTSRFFRFHVSGDIVNADYFENMVKLARRNIHCQILCFTKKYKIVNDFIDKGQSLPDNLNVIFSCWREYPISNIHNLPVAHVRYKDGCTTADDTAQECPGNCSDCAVEQCGCWALKSGDSIVFNEH